MKDLSIKEQSFLEFKNELEKNYFAEVPYPLSQSELHATAQSFLSFLALPQEVKEEFYYLRDQKNHRSRLGYVRKEKGKGDGYDDSKEYVHYHSMARAVFEERQGWGEPVVQDFFERAELVFQASTDVLHDVFSILSLRFPNIIEQFFPKDKDWRLTARFLKYDVSSEGDFLAIGHYDGGGCTLALAESAPGLRIGSGPDSLTPVSHKERSAFFLPSFTLRNVTDETFLPAWHDVVQSSKDTLSKDTARWAIVFFADPYNGKVPSAEEVHTPLTKY